MSEEHTKIISVKRKGAKKSGYEVSGKGSSYVVSKAPPRARVAPGDKIVSINGVGSDDFADADEANDLIESCQLVVVPKVELDEYDRLKAEEEAAEESEGDLEETVRRGKGIKGKGGGKDDDQLEESARRGKGKKGAADEQLVESSTRGKAGKDVSDMDYAFFLENRGEVNLIFV
jgi:hypothetical protein